MASRTGRYVVVAEGDARRRLAGVVPEMRVQLRTARVADGVHVLRDSEAIIRCELAVLGRHADRVEAKAVERQVSTDGEQDLVPLDRVAVADLDDVRAVRRPLPRARESPAR